MGPGQAPVPAARRLPAPLLPPLRGPAQFGQLQPNPTAALEEEFPDSEALQNNPWLLNPWPESNRQHNHPKAVLSPLGGDVHGPLAAQQAVSDQESNV